MATVTRQVPDLSFLLNHVSYVLRTRMDAAFAEIGLTPRGYCVLSKAMAGDYTQIELAKLSDLDKTTMVITLDELEKLGYAERRPSPADRRARIVAVTPAGAAAVDDGTAIADRVHREVLEALAPDQRDVFRSALESLVGGLLAEPVECDHPVRRPRA
jgi:MarR family transcriptional regulator, transcriptional regulator for hemolysin